VKIAKPPIFRRFAENSSKCRAAHFAPGAAARRVFVVTIICEREGLPTPSPWADAIGGVGEATAELKRRTGAAAPHPSWLEQGRAATASGPTNREYRHHTNPFRTASSLRADMIFGKDRVATVPSGHGTGTDAVTREPRDRAWHDFGAQSGSPQAHPGSYGP
jgi:hypothetical protein